MGMGSTRADVQSCRRMVIQKVCAEGLDWPGRRDKHVIGGFRFSHKQQRETQKIIFMCILYTHIYTNVYMEQ